MIAMTDAIPDLRIDPEFRALIPPLQYDAEKRRAGRPEKLDQNDPIIPAASAESTAERLAEEHKVSPMTIKRDAQFSRAVETIASILGEDARDVILRRETPGAQESLTPSGLGKNEVIKLAKLAKVNPGQARARFEGAINGQAGGNGRPKGRGSRRSRERDDQVPFVPAPQSEEGRERQPSLIEQKTPEDEAWLASFPLRSRVVAYRFDEDAILYRDFEELIRGLKPRLHALIGPRSDLGMTPIYRHLLKLSFVPPIDQWQICDRCDGSGISGGICRKCHGGGYMIPPLVTKGHFPGDAEVHFQRC
jgi:hypothetical protein